MAENSHQFIVKRSLCFCAQQVYGTIDIIGPLISFAKSCI